MAFLYLHSSRPHAVPRQIERLAREEMLKRMRQGDPIAYGTYDLVSGKLSVRYCGPLTQSFDGL
jgi:hypothetical protein